MKELNGVNLVSLFGYWHLHRVVNGRHFFANNHPLIGLTVTEELPSAVKDWRERDFQETRTFIEKGEEKSYVDEPYTLGQIESFGKLTLEALERWVARGT